MSTKIVLSEQRQAAQAVYEHVESAVLLMDQMIDAAGYETQSLTVEQLVEEAEAILAESASEMSPQVQEDFKAALAKMKGALAGLKSHFAKMGHGAKGEYHAAMSKLHHKNELGNAIKAAKAYRSGDNSKFTKHIEKASSAYDKGAEHGDKAHKALSAARGVVAKDLPKQNPYATVKSKLAPRMAPKKSQNSISASMRKLLPSGK
jgi:hypothetical protein